MKIKFSLLCALFSLIAWNGFSGGALEPKTIASAGARPRSITYAETLNGVDQSRYEFMITTDGRVIFKKEGDIWRYFGDNGYSLDTTDFDNDFKPIGPVDMIAACGNRVFVKTKGTNKFYFAEIIDGNIKLDKGDGSEFNYSPTTAGCPFFITSAPNNYSIYDSYDNYVENHILDHGNTRLNIEPALALLLPLSKNEATKIVNLQTGGSMQGVGSLNNLLLDFAAINRATTLPAIPYSWPVVVEKRKWYRLKADNLSGLKVIDIGASEVNKIEAARYIYHHPNNLEKYFKKFGGEFWRGYQEALQFNSLFIDTANNKYDTGSDYRDYGSLVDGVANYYVLTSDNGKYQVWYLDEQAFFCSQWYKFSENFEFSIFQQGLSFIVYNPNNWTNAGGSWLYRNVMLLWWIIYSYYQVNMADDPRFYNAWDFARNQFDLDGDYLPQFVEVGPNAIDGDPWIWTAYENVHQPEVVILDPLHNSIVPYFNKGQWITVPGFLGNSYSLVSQYDNQSSPMWAKYPDSIDQPSLAVSKVGNIALCTKTKIYTLNFAWGSLDFSWRERKKPTGSIGSSIGNNVYLQYSDTSAEDTPADKLGRLYIIVPGINSRGEYGYFRQNYLPKSCLLNDTIHPTYDYPDKQGTGIPPISTPQDKWEWIPRSSSGFTNSIFDFPRMPVFINPSEKWLNLHPELFPNP